MEKQLNMVEISLNRLNFETNEWSMRVLMAHEVSASG